METTFATDEIEADDIASLPAKLPSEGMEQEVAVTREAVMFLRPICRAMAYSAKDNQGDGAAYGLGESESLKRLYEAVEFCYGPKVLRWIKAPDPAESEAIDPGFETVTGGEDVGEVKQADAGFSAMSLDRVRLRRDLDSVFNHGKCTRAEYDRYSGMIGVQRLSAADVQGVQQFISTRNAMIRENAFPDAQHDADKTANWALGRKK